MVEYTPEEVKKLIAMLQNIPQKKNKTGEPTRLEKQIKYLQQRFKFFNPSKEMIDFIIRQTENSKTKLDPNLLKKLKEESVRKTPY